MVVREIALVLSLLGQLGAAGAGEGIAPTPTRSWLQWSSSDPAGACADSSEFAQQVEKRLGRSPAIAAAELELSIDARIERLPGPPPHWTGELRVHGRDGAPEGVRSIDRAGEACEPLTATLALMAALVLQPSGERSPAPPAPVGNPAPPPQRQVDAPAPEETVVAGEPGGSSRRWMISVAVGPAVAFGLLPDPSLAAEAAVAVRRGGGMLVVSASLSSKESTFINATQGATLSRGAVEIAGCWSAPAWSSRTLALCGGAEVGRLRAVGFGFDLSTAQEHWSVDLAAGAELHQRIVGPLFAAIAAELLVPLQRDRIAYTDPSGRPEEIFTTAPVAGSGRLLIGVTFR